MKKILLSLFLLIAMCATPAFAYNLRDFSSDAKILSAMQLLEQMGENDVFNNMKKNAIKVKFYNLSGYGSVYATNSYDSSGRRVILINSVYANAPVEQIACLIAHESMHVLRKPTLEEETIATQKEAATWIKLRQSGVSYPQNKLTKRLENLAELQMASSGGGQNYIQTKIANSSFYKAQFGM